MQAESHSVEDVVPAVARFRLLCVGLPSVGKTSVINRVLGLDGAVAADWEREETDVNIELTSDDNPSFVLHDCRGFEPGDTNTFNIVSRFIEERCGSNLPLQDRLHAVWLFTETPRAGGSAFGPLDEKLLRLTYETQTPLVIVFTKYDRLVRTKKDELQEDEGDLAQDVLNMRSKEDARIAFDVCLDALRRTMARMQAPMPHYVNVTTHRGYEAEISTLVEVTRDAVHDRLTGAEEMWLRAQRAISQSQLQPAQSDSRPHEGHAENLGHSLSQTDVPPGYGPE